MKKDEIQALLYDLENDRVERTISTTNTDKFGQAICAFANDLPNHQQSSYLFLGVKDAALKMQNYPSYDFLRCNFFTLKSGRGQHSKYLPYAFTQEGIAQLQAEANHKELNAQRNPIGFIVPEKK